MARCIVGNHLRSFDDMEAEATKRNQAEPVSGKRQGVFHLKNSQKRASHDHSDCQSLDISRNQ